MRTSEKKYGTLITPKGSFAYEYFFYHNSNYNIDTYSFTIWDETDRSGKQKADFSLLIMADGMRLKVIDMFMKDYRGNKIGIGMVLKAKQLFGKQVISSSNATQSKNFTGEANWPDAIKYVWQPLVQQGLAVYDQSSDLYVLL